MGDENKELIQKHVFSETVIKIIRSFVSLRSFDDIINESLKNLGEVCAAGRSYLFILKNNNTEMDNTHEWCAHGVEPQIENLNGIPADMVPWWMEKLNKGETIYTESVELLPEEATAEKEILQAQNIKSIVVLPVFYNETLHGFIGLDNVLSNVSWTKEVFSYLEIASDVVGSAIARRDNENSLLEKKMSLERINAELSEAKRRLEAKSITDELTGLLNRRGVLEKMQTEFYRFIRKVHPNKQDDMDEADTGTFCGIIDIDFFKNINDTYGHQSGDYVLKRLGEILNSGSLFRKTDICGRYGGEEFIFILSECSKSKIAIPCEKIINTVKNTDFALPCGNTIRITLSIGVSIFKDHNDSIDDIIKRADTALYKAKETGRNKTVFFEEKWL